MGTSLKNGAVECKEHRARYTTERVEAEQERSGAGASGCAKQGTAKITELFGFFEIGYMSRMIEPYDLLLGGLQFLSILHD